MGSQNFMADFLAGWNNGLRTRAMKNAEEQEMYNRQQDEFKRQQEMEDRQLRLENYKIQKQELDLRMKQEKLAAAQQEKAMREQAMALQSQLPTPTAAEVGIPEQGPEFGGPMASEVQVPQPMMPMPSPTGGADIQTPVLTGRQQQEMAQQERLRKELERVGLLREQERVKAEFRQPERPVSVSPGGTLIDPSTGKVIFKAPEKEGGSGGGKGLSQYAESNVINRLSNQWANATKSSGEIARQVSVMETGLDQARKGNLAAGSQAVLVTFQKILDPTSVVRESEYARSAEGQSILNRMKGALERLQKGGAGVPLSELEKYAQTARALAQGQLGHANATRERIGKVADRYNIPRELVLENYDYGAAMGGSSGGEVEFIRDPKTGKLVRK